jgi:hypothetical protein
VSSAAAALTDEIVHERRHRALTVTGVSSAANDEYVVELTAPHLHSFSGESRLPNSGQTLH